MIKLFNYLNRVQVLSTKSVLLIIILILLFLMMVEWSFGKINSKKNNADLVIKFIIEFHDEKNVL